RVETLLERSEEAMRTRWNALGYVRFRVPALAAVVAAMCVGISAEARADAREEAAQVASVDPAASLDTQIRRVYIDVYARIPEDWEVQVWMNNVQTGGWSIDRMRAAFVQDDQCKTAIVRVYQEMFNRTPEDWEIGAWRNNLLNGWSIAKM